MTKIAEDLKTQDKKFLIDLVNEFDNEENLKVYQTKAYILLK